MEGGQWAIARQWNTVFGISSVLKGLCYFWKCATAGCAELLWVAMRKQSFPLRLTVLFVHEIRQTARWRRTSRGRGHWTSCRKLIRDFVPGVCTWHKNRHSWCIQQWENECFAPSEPLYTWKLCGLSWTWHEDSYGVWWLVHSCVRLWERQDYRRAFKPLKGYENCVISVAFSNRIVESCIYGHCMPANP